MKKSESCESLEEEDNLSTSSLDTDGSSGQSDREESTHHDNDKLVCQRREDRQQQQKNFVFYLVDLVFSYNKMNLLSSSFFILMCFWILFITFFQSSLFMANETTQQGIAPVFMHTQNIHDFDDGNLAKVQAIIDSSQYTFVYLYAHWCARSIFFKELIQKLADHFEKKISFTAVNCFNPTGECRKTFNLNKYPQIIVQIRDVGLYSYKGPFEFNYMREYLELLQRPLTRIDNLAEFMDFILINDGAVIGKFDFSKKNDNNIYKVFYHSSLTSLNQNFENPIRYGVVLNSTLWSEIIDISHTYSKYSRYLNKRKKIVYFSPTGIVKSLYNLRNFSAEILSSWAQKNAKPSLRWYYPDKYYHHSYNLNRLLVFIPREQIIPSRNLYNNQFINIKYLILNHVQELIKSKSATNRKFLEFIISYIESTNVNVLDSCHLVSVNERLRRYLGEFKAEDEYFYCSSDEGKGLTSEFKIMKDFFIKNEILLIDSDLYSNYGSSLINNKSNIIENKAVFIDYKNESLYLMAENLNYRNIKKFIIDQSIGVNKRLMRTNDIKTDKKNKSNVKVLVKEINAKQLEDIVNGNDPHEEYKNKDLLIFYKNNWCGFCKSVNFNLMQIKHKYFNKVDSFQILKIDTEKNDLPWSLHVQNIPELLFIPSRINSGSKIVDSVPYHATDPNRYKSKFLIEFILSNSRNPATILDFLKYNYIDRFKSETENLSKKSRLRYTIIDSLDKKLQNLQLKTKNLNSKLEKISLLNPAKENIETDMDNSTINSESYYSEKLNIYLTDKILRYEFDIKTIKDFIDLIL